MAYREDRPRQGGGDAKTEHVRGVHLAHSGKSQTGCRADHGENDGKGVIGITEGEHLLCNGQWKPSEARDRRGMRGEEKSRVLGVGWG